jgi:hypothetical protein
MLKNFFTREVLIKSREDFKRWPKFDPITYAFIENSNFSRKFCLRCKGKTLLGIINKLFISKVEGDGIEYRGV